MTTISRVLRDVSASDKRRVGPSVPKRLAAKKTPDTVTSRLYGARSETLVPAPMIRKASLLDAASQLNGSTSNKDASRKGSG